MAEKFKILSVSGKGKGLNIFKSSSYDEHERLPTAQVFWVLRWNVAIWLVCALAFALAFGVEHIWRYGWSLASAKWMSVYFHNALYSGGLSVIAEIPFWIERCVLRTDLQCIVPLVPIIAYFFMVDGTLTEEFNPYGKDRLDKKSSREATAEDIKEMGLFGGFMMVLGYFKNKPLMMEDCLSTLCVAPPGTGKTVGVVIPSICDCDSVSMIINDPKPELKQKTSAYRATIGPVFIMNWAGQDDPEHGIYYPSWNPLSPEHVPETEERRDLYIDSICKVLVPDNPSSSADPHWSLSGRSALEGLVQYIVSKVEKARADDYFVERMELGEFDENDASLLEEFYLSMVNNPNAFAALALLQKGELNKSNYVHVGTWENIPPAWIGKEASLPLILDWWNASQLAIAAQVEERKRQGDQMVSFADPIKDMLEVAVEEARMYSYAHRAILELTQLANTPDKERGSIVSTFMAGLAIFRNAAVRNRTSHSDFHFEDLRGMMDPRDGKIKPVSVYLSINMVDAEALNPITGIFIELMSSWLLTNPPNTQLADKKLGPCPVLFVLDEMPKMIRLQAVIQGPDLGRGQQISYLIIGQDIHQIREKYGADAASTIISTTAAKVVLRQNDPETAKTFSEMMGDKVKIKMEKGPDGKEVETKKSEPLFTPMDIMKLKKFKQLVIYQGWYHRPIMAEAAPYFLKKTAAEKKLAAKVAMGEAAPMPEFLIPSHHKAMGYEGNPKSFDMKTKEIKELQPAE